MGYILYLPKLDFPFPSKNTDFVLTSSLLSIFVKFNGALLPWVPCGLEVWVGIWDELEGM